MIHIEKPLLNGNGLLETQTSLAEALAWLKVMKDPYVSFDYWPKLKKAMKKQGLHLNDIETTVCEIQNLREVTTLRYIELKKYWEIMELKPQAVRQYPEPNY